MSIVKHDVKKEGWEKSDFPIVCGTCLGDNPCIRMTKAEFEKECKICSRPFTIFRWRPGAKARYKKTEICQTCAKLKNVCQTCLLDLEFGLPVQVRDSVNADLEDQTAVVTDVTREWLANQAEIKLRDGITNQNAAPNASLLKMARTKPYYERNSSHICSFFLKGDCNRGSECPYRHERPSNDPALSKQNIRDRYMGVNDPVAKKMLNKKADVLTKPLPPADRDITTLFVGGVTANLLTETDMRDHFYAYGEIKGVKLIPKGNCAFVTYTTREAAERAVDCLWNGKLVVKGQQLRVSWAKPQPVNRPTTTTTTSEQSNSTPYPSMDPNMMGSRPEGLGESAKQEA
eukprot:TRINITY_DN7462_c0_g1_i1.p1 TRINITY_DN7462_c0_g1~~TRINITY_DN7462_c0_g1_i1.p1  ORF type:complete len:345 (-),score=81.90 TRINITY_DN7462_c0_g1_i1:88-1122(-)